MRVGKRRRRLLAPPLASAAPLPAPPPSKDQGDADVAAPQDRAFDAASPQDASATARRELGRCGCCRCRHHSCGCCRAGCHRRVQGRWSWFLGSRAQPERRGTKPGAGGQKSRQPGTGPRKFPPAGHTRPSVPRDDAPVPEISDGKMDAEVRLLVWHAMRGGAYQVSSPPPIGEPDVPNQLAL